MIRRPRGPPPRSTSVARPPAARRDLRDRLRQESVIELEWEDEGDYTGVKVQDPDGYVVELAYDEA